MRRMFRRLFGGGGALLALFCAVALLMPTSALALDLATPEHHKTIADNGDGTYTLSLDVKGGKDSESTTVTSKADIVLVMDTSGSMKYRMDKDEEPWAWPWEQKEKTRLDYAKDAARGLIDSVVKDGSDDVRVSVVSFSNGAKIVQGFSSDKERLASAVDGLRANGGTNWEAGLAEANGFTSRDGAKKYIIFLSDGEPTYCLHGGNGQSYQQRFFDHAVTEAKKGTDAGATLFSVAVGNTRKVSERMNAFQQQVTGSTAGCYSATTPEELARAFADITQQITSTVQYTNVTITDKLTQYVELAGADGNVRVTARDASGSAVELSPSDYTVIADGDTVRLAFRQGSGNELGFILEDGVTYTVSLDVKPTQAAYDAAVDAGAETALPTNAEGTLNYSVINSNGASTTVIAGTPEAYDPQQIMVPVSTVSIQKVWNGGTVRPDSISVNLMRDGEPYKTVALNKSAGYRADVVVPAGVDSYSWSVEEADAPAGYTPSYSAAVAGAGTLTITNTYSVSPVTVDGKANLSGHKTLTGRDLKAGEFDFVLADASGKVIQTVTNDAEGNFNFDDLTFTEPGTYAYTVTEDTSNLPTGVSPVTVGSKAVKIVVTDNGDGTLRADVEKDGLEFENAYEANSVMFPKLSFAKVLTGREGGVRDGEFAFQLKDESDAVIATAKNDASGTVTFSPRLVLGEAGTYAFTVSEVNGGEKGVTYDTAVRTVTITVTDDGEGQLVAEVAIDGDTTFTNRYEPAGTSITFGATKRLSGADLAAGQFAFELRDGRGNVLATATNAADGSVVFGDLALDAAGEYHFTMSEVNDGQANVTYDETVHNLDVTVADDGEGHLYIASYTVDGAADLPVFSNAYTAPAAVEVPSEPSEPGEPSETAQPAATPNTGDATASALPVALGAAVLLAAGLVGLRHKRQ